MAVLAVDCGGTNLTAARWDAGELERRSVPAPRDAREIPAAIVDVVRPLLGGCEAAGVGLAGLVDHRSGVLVWSPHAAGSDVPIAEELSRSLDIPVVVDNDANMAVLAEGTAGAGARHRMVLCVTVGTGIGGGLMIEGRIERGRGFGGEIGHMPFDLEGRPCPCGHIGCWETAASGSSLDFAALRLAASDPDGAVSRVAGRSRPIGKHLVEAAGEGDASAVDAIAGVGRALGRGLAGVVALLDPDVVVVAGSVASIGEPILGPARQALADQLEGAPHRSPTLVEPAHFGADAGLAGAALAAREVVEG